MPKWSSGYTEDLPPDPEIPHWIMTNDVEKDGRIYLVARIRLYAYLGTPIYSVVVAIMPDLKGKTDKTISVEQFLDTKLIKPALGF